MPVIQEMAMKRFDGYLKYSRQTEDQKSTNHQSRAHSTSQHRLHPALLTLLELYPQMQSFPLVCA